ncbi:MAG: hypothetical protein QXN67_10590 [Thermoproteota archaeon]
MLEGSSTHRDAGRSNIALAVSFVLIGVFIGGLVSYAFNSLFIVSRIDELQNKLSNLEKMYPHCS